VLFCLIISIALSTKMKSQLNHLRNSIQMSVIRSRRSFTLGWMMMAVVALALVLGGEVTRQRWAQYRETAICHGEVEIFHRFLLGGGVAVLEDDSGKVVTLMGPTTEIVATADGQTGFIQSIPNEPTLQPDYLKRCVDYYSRLKQKYERATSRPWLLVEPDPPPPTP
jgi:hypothetical protein